ncbi:hypothetical protein G3I44_14200 [Halogeometricum borinquense]|uniref:Uncharacterized protein n=1 Tax=Halogeometricum borinquense TaxID=60847 RepID=A0A6C0UJE2_9EURY|nr:hypothetical protein [Halogeometricum borinquense]QIB75337.1 hypothetical protein G3I44_14200 [Halogeometricum borinquense]
MVADELQRDDPDVEKALEMLYDEMDWLDERQGYWKTQAEDLEKRMSPEMQEAIRGG